MKRPGNVFLHDSLDVENPKAQQPIQQQDWRIYAVTFVFIFALILVLIGVLAWAHTLIYADQIGLIRLGWFLIVILYGLFGIGLVGAVSTGILYLYNRAMKAGLVNVATHQVHVDRMRGVEDRYLDVLNTRAEHSIFEGVQNLTYGHTLSNIQKESSAAHTLPEHVDTPETQLPILEQLIQEGLIARSGNSFLLGFSEDEE